MSSSNDILKVVWRFVVLSFSNSYLFYSPQQEFFYLSLCLRENTNHNHSEPLTDQCTLSFHCQTSACSPARENESPTYTNSSRKCLLSFNFTRNSSWKKTNDPNVRVFFLIISSSKTHYLNFLHINLKIMDYTFPQTNDLRSLTTFDN